MTRPVLLASRSLILALVLALVLPASAGANDRSLKSALATWSRQIKLDARSVGLSASRRHPQRMTGRARTFRVDALRARRAVSSIRASSVRGRQAQKLATTAFGDYARVGREWELTGRARVAGSKSGASAHAKLATRYAKAANRLLVQAAKLVR
ncbi:MAG: hypothetical protein M3R37_02955 [Actinomycetota bacterium]|nr:hypothetical protein [Actinomycetota bacterium]